MKLEHRRGAAGFLDHGDLQLVNNYAILQSRTPFEDFEDADAKRHLLRLWLAMAGL